MNMRVVQDSDHQAAALHDFVECCAKDGLLKHPPELKAGDRNYGLNDEPTLLRFLSARSLDVQAALKQYKESLKAHHDNHIAELYDKIDVDVFEELRAIYPHWSGCFNKCGLPIFIFDVINLDNAAIKSYEKKRSSTPSVPGINSGHKENYEIASFATSINSAQRALVYHDYVTRFVFPLCSKLGPKGSESRKEITKCIYLVNISSLSLKQVWDLRNYAQDVSRLLAINYPEVVDRIYVLNAPYYYNMIWGIIKKFIDPVTAEKLVIVSSEDVLECLRKDIDLDNIPKEFGGEYNYQHGMLPLIARELCVEIEWSDPENMGKIPPGPIKWVHQENLDKAVAVGRENGVPRYSTILSHALSK